MPTSPKGEPRERAELFATRRGKVLLVKGLDGTPLTFGGGVDKGETPEDAAKREYLEEGGYEVTNVRQLPIPPVVHKGKGGKDQKTYFFQGELKGRRKTPEDPHPAGKGALRSARLAAKKMNWTFSGIHKARKKALEHIAHQEKMKKAAMAGFMDGYLEVLRELGL